MPKRKVVNGKTLVFNGNCIDERIKNAISLNASNKLLEIVYGGDGSNPLISKRGLSSEARHIRRYAKAIESGDSKIKVT